MEEEIKEIRSESIHESVGADGEKADSFENGSFSESKSS